MKAKKLSLDTVHLNLEYPFQFNKFARDLRFVLLRMTAHGRKLPFKISAVLNTKRSQRAQRNPKSKFSSTLRSLIYIVPSKLK